MPGEARRSAGWAGELDGDHGGPGNAFDAAAHIEMEVCIISLQQGALLEQLPPAVIAVDDLDRVAAERLEVPIGLKLIPDPRAADFQNIRLSEQAGVVESFAHGGAQSGAVIQRDVIAVGAADLKLQRHRLQVSQHLHIRQLEPMGCSSTGGHGCEVREEWMGQGLRRKVSRARRPDGGCCDHPPGERNSPGLDSMYAMVGAACSAACLESFDHHINGDLA